MKLKRKFGTGNLYVGVVGGHSRMAEGRTKREATKRLRAMFHQAGISTTDSLVDHLVVCLPVPPDFERESVTVARAAGKPIRIRSPRRVAHPEPIDA